jgi:hypothetical protein
MTERKQIVSRSKGVFAAFLLTVLWTTGFVTGTAKAELVGHWTFDTDFSDSSGNGFHGRSLTPDDCGPCTDGAAITTQAKFGAGSLSVDHHDGVAVMTSDQFYSKFTDTLSVTAWVAADREPLFGGDYGFVIGKGEDTVFQLETRTGDTLSFQITTRGGSDARIDATTPVGFLDDGEFHHLAGVYNPDESLATFYIDGENVGDAVGSGVLTRNRYPIWIGHDPQNLNEGWGGLIDDVALFNHALTEEEVLDIFQNGVSTDITVLRAGDADQDLDFDQLDLVRVQIAAKYLTSQPATWGDGDWDGAPGGKPGSPPAGNSRFDQLDIIAALGAGHYLKGPYAAIRQGGRAGDGQTSITYNAGTGEVAVDAPAGQQLTSINIDSAGAIFTGASAQNLGGSFDNDADANIFKATFGSSFGSLSFGNVAQAGLSESFLLNDLTVVGSLAGGGALGNVDLVYVPEPAALWLAAMGLIVLWKARGFFGS